MSHRFWEQPLLLLVLILGSVLLGNALVSSRHPARSRQDAGSACPQNSSVLSFQGDCGGYDVYILGYTDANGYHVVDPNDMILTGCTGGHLDCPHGCKFEPRQAVHAPAPRFIVNQSQGQIFWDNYDIGHSVSNMGCGTSGDCYSDVNQELYIGREGYQTFSCTKPSGLFQ